MLPILRRLFCNLEVSSYQCCEGACKKCYCEGAENKEPKEEFLGNKQKSTMAEWSEVPETVLVSIASFLSLRDRISASFVCKDWYNGLEQCYQSITIDPSSPFGGSWIEYNQFKSKQGNDPEKLLKEMSKLITDLSKCTSTIEEINMDCNFLQREDIERLFSSQEMIVKLRLTNDLTKCNVAPQSMIETIIEGILMHRKSLLVVDISLIGYCSPLPYLRKLYEIEGNNISFPNLTSIKLEPISVLGNNFSLIFEKTFSKNKMKKIGIESKWLTVSLGSLLGNGNLSEVTELDTEISVDEAKMIMNNCTKITHIGKNFLIKDDDMTKSQLSKVIARYGTQLNSIECNVNRTCFDTIKIYCTNLKELRLHNIHKIDFGCIGDLKQLKKLHISLKTPSRRNEIAFILKECGENLESLIITGEYFQDRELMTSIELHCKKLKELHMEVFEGNMGRCEFIKVTATKSMAKYANDDEFVLRKLMKPDNSTSYEVLLDFLQRHQNILKEFMIRSYIPENYMNQMIKISSHFKLLTSYR